MTGRFAAYGALAALAIGGIWLMFVAAPRWYGPEPPPPASASATSGAPGASRRIKARLFYVSDDGMRLVASEQEIAYGEGTLEQGRRLIEAQLAAPRPPLTSAIPAGARLRDLFITANGEAFVDLSPEVAAAHPGGALTELLTVYTIVDLLTANLPAITSVQILIDGKETDTLAGHVDLRRPLVKDLRWTDQEPQVQNPQ